MPKKLIITLIVASIIVFLSGCMEVIPTPFTETFEKEYSIEGVSSLEVYNFNGSVTIRIWDKDTVKVFYTKKATFSKSDLNNVRITVEKGKTLLVKSEKLTANPQVSITYEISIPKNLEISNIETSNGKINIDGTSGYAILRSSNGGITIKSHSGNVDASTSNGNIDIENVTGDVNIRTSNGGMTIYNIKGKGKFETSNGGIEAKSVSSIISARTSNGKINVELLSTQQGGADLSTSNASITCSISKKLNLDIDASTSNGKIEISNIDIVASTISERVLRGKLGTGGAPLSITTSNASIYITGID